MPSGFQIFVVKSSIIFSVAPFKAMCLFFFFCLWFQQFGYSLSLCFVCVCVYLVYTCFCVCLLFSSCLGWTSWILSVISFNQFLTTQPFSLQISYFVLFFWTPITWILELLTISCISLLHLFQFFVSSCASSFLLFIDLPLNSLTFPA